MDTHRSLAVSRQIYTRLLYLYPQAHRAEYGADMLQLFTDQCRAARESGKRLALLALWLRTLADLGVSALREQIASPRLGLGLLEAVPDEPLPWKGVALVLLPGLLFFIAQVAQLNGQDWFFLMVFRAAYFLMVPVLVVWVWKRKFPLWGLIPLGLLIKTLMVPVYRLLFWNMSYPYPVLRELAGLLIQVPRVNIEIGFTVLLLLTFLALLWLAKRRAGIPGWTWVWLSVYLLLVAFITYKHAQEFYTYNPPTRAITPLQTLLYIFDLIFYNIYNYGGLLGLILLGSLLSGRHGRLTTLLPFGYLLPTVIYGRVSNEWPAPTDPLFTLMLSVGAAALIFRFLVALAGPLWIVRSATLKMQKQASTLSLVVPLAIPTGFNLTLLLSAGQAAGQLGTAFGVIAEQLVPWAAIALALTLYRAADDPQAAARKAQPSLDHASAV